MRKLFYFINPMEYGMEPITEMDLKEATKLAVEALELCIKDSKEGTIMRSYRFMEAVSIIKEQNNLSLSEILWVEDSLELVLSEAEKKLEVIEANCKDGSIDEYEDFKDALELIESIVLKSINKGGACQTIAKQHIR